MVVFIYPIAVVIWTHIQHWQSAGPVSVQTHEDWINTINHLNKQTFRRRYTDYRKTESHRITETREEKHYDSISVTAEWVWGFPKRIESEKYFFTIFINVVKLLVHINPTFVDLLDFCNHRKIGLIEPDVICRWWLISEDSPTWEIPNYPNYGIMKGQLSCFSRKYY